LYYKYVNIENPENFKAKQTELCKKLGLKGRVIISSEGINGTIGGSKESTTEYISETKKYPGMVNMEWKISESKTDPFPKLRIVAREEIVTLGFKKTQKDVNLQNKANYIEPEELKNLYDKGEDFIIIDARNEYEGRIGKFKNAIVPDIKVFRQFPEFVKTIGELKNKPIVTYCTGGIRCEKASAYLREQGFTNVRQLHGGIHEYSEKAGGKNFEGEMYVFDARINIKVNHENPTIISKCIHCGESITRYINCANKLCNKQIVCCEKCQNEKSSTCSDKCRILVQNKVTS